MIKAVRMKGLKELRAALKKVREDAHAAADRAVYVAGNEVMTDAKMRAPIDTGVLRASGYVTLPENGKVELGFGGAAAEYALVQHERTEFRHETGEAKFLENAINAVDVEGIVGEEMRRGVIDGDTTLPPGSHRSEPE